ncbi:MAG: recombination protein RecR [Candidatus Midichloriaceae bacterium]|jgi:recombination protein RecR
MENDCLQQLIKSLSKLPGLGYKSAKRIALHMIQNKNEMLQFNSLINQTLDQIIACKICHNIDVINPCNICSDSNRDGSILCIVETISDLWAIEKSKNYNGLYHVLGGVLSAIEGKTPENLNISDIEIRAVNSSIDEVIIATNSTLEGQTTGHYIAKILESQDIKISRLANGIPIGADLDYIDDGTLSLALKLRHKF